MKEAQHVSKARSESFTGWDDLMLIEPEQMCTESQRYFAKLYIVRGMAEPEVEITSYFDGMSHLSFRGAEFCEMPITAEYIRDTMTRCIRKESREWNGMK